MCNIDKLNKVFAKTFDVEEDKVSSLAYNGIPLWDSVGQMTIITNLEDEFNIVIRPEDIMDINSYSAAKFILNTKYHIPFE